MNEIYQKIDHLIIKENQGRLSSKERLELDSWIAERNQNFDYYIDVKKTYDSLQWDKAIKIPKMEFDTSVLKDEKSNIIPLIIKIAAVLIISLATSYYYYNDSQVYDHRIISSTSQLKTVHLPDGSLITLNKNSSIYYDMDFNKNDRRVTLKGEAFFDIQKSKKAFIISANQSKIEVLGTHFNVNTNSNQTKVDVQSGKVKFSNGVRSVFLTKGLSAHTVGKELTVDNTTLKSYQIATWKSDKWVFRNEKLGDIFKFLEEKYNVNLKVDDSEINNLTIVASMSKESIDNILQNIADVYELKIIKKEAAYIIKR